MTPDEKAAEWDRRMEAYETPEEAEDLVNRILYGDPDAPKTKFRKRRLKGSDLIVKET